MSQRSDIIKLQGGLDLVSPAMAVGKGMAIGASNYEVEVRGYRRLTGYERLDGRPAPSAAAYFTLNITGGASAPAVGELITGLTSGATGLLLAAPVLVSGDWALGTGVGRLTLDRVSGAFTPGETLRRPGAITVGVLEGSALRNGAPTDAEDRAMSRLSRDARRADIAPPPGSGPVRGVATFNGETYCWRDNVAGTAGQMLRASAGGWVAQTFGRLLKFDAGTTEPKEGETLTGALSGATAIIRRVVKQGFAWDGNAVGYLSLSSVTGAFQDNETVNSASGSVRANGVDTAITLPPGGKYRALVENFYATAGSARLYFVNGVGPAMEWDGIAACPILTGTPDALERPRYLAVHRLHLFLGYAGGSLQHSVGGLPLVFDGALLAGEIGFGQELTGMKSNTRDSLIITGRNKIGYLTGSNATEFDLKSISEDSGAVEDTLEIVGSPIFLDDQGVRDMQAAQTFGDWTVGTMTRMVEPLLRSNRDAGVLPVGAIRVRAKDQYRLFFSDGTGIVIYFGRESPEVLTLSLPFTPFCFTSGEGADGYEVLLAGSEDGWVYQLDSGTSFDGLPIEAYLRLSFMNQGMPNQHKRYHRARLEGQAGRLNSALAMTADFSYGSPDVANTPEIDLGLNKRADIDNSPDNAFTFEGGGGFWDEANWNEFVWSSQVEGQAFADLDGIGENISVVFMSSADDEEPHTLSVLTINYTTRKRLR